MREASHTYKLDHCIKLIPLSACNFLHKTTKEICITDRVLGTSTFLDF